MSKLPGVSLSFTDLISAYKIMQDKLVEQIKSLSKNTSSANPGQFLLLQFQMAQVTQMGESMSNLISQVNSVISKAIQNQQTR
jgi:hypothetical protein